MNVKLFKQLKDFYFLNKTILFLVQTKLFMCLCVSWCKVRAIVSGRNWQYLGSWATNQKSKDTLLSQTLKVEEKKVTLVF